jgi:excisionase family DNA binding protein
MGNENNSQTVFERKHTAEKLHISLVTLDRMLNKKRIAHFRVGRRVLFTQTHIDEYIERNTTKAK